MSATVSENSAVVPIDAADLAWARQEHKATQRRMVELLEERLKCTPGELAQRVASTLRLRYFSYGHLAAMQSVFDVIPYVEASRRGCLASRDEEGSLFVSLFDPYDTELQDWIEERVTTHFEYAVTHRQDLMGYLSQQEEKLRAMDGIAAGVDSSAAHGRHNEQISLEAISDAESAVIRLVNSTLYDALKANVSDVHLGTTATGLVIKYRIDGVLTLVERLQGTEFADQVISRVKVMSELDIAERRVPQDGRFRANVRGRDVDFRVSIMPSIFGEDAVIRILDRRSLATQTPNLTLDDLGFAPHLLEGVRELASQPYGMLLITGPTGSGKTTTIYGIISEIDQGLDKIVTIEDPVEYHLPGVLQIPVNEKKGLTFARGLRSILRHDPDRIMVGEIRDPETAEIAVQSALTGHLVYTTVHANNVYDVIGRFMHMGIDLYNFVSAVNCILAQRLIRINCSECSVGYTPDGTLLKRSRLTDASTKTFNFMHGRGCTACRGTGYCGRRAIGELLVMNDDIRELIIGRAPLRNIKTAARDAGTRSLREEALDLVRSGMSTLEEINRVTFVA